MTKPAATLNELIEITRDGLNFYTDAIGKIANPHLKIVFRGMIDAKHHLIGALAENVKIRGDKPAQDGTLAGSFHKLYADVRTGIGSAKDALWVAELEAAEDRLLGAFEEAARDASDPLLHRVILQNLPKVRLCHEQMRNLKMDLAA